MVSAYPNWITIYFNRTVQQFNMKLLCSRPFNANYLGAMISVKSSTCIIFAEPGYYEDGSFGIRLENVLIVKEANTKYNFGDKGYLAFEHITWVSIVSSISILLNC